MDFIEELEKEKKENIPFNKHAADKFLSIYKAKFGKDGAESFYEEQSNLFSNVVAESDPLKKCSGFSLFNAFISIALPSCAFPYRAFGFPSTNLLAWSSHLLLFFEEYVISRLTSSMSITL